MRAIELFCGAGGMSLGLRRAGFELVQAYDSWAPAVEAYRCNVGRHVWQRDLKDIFQISPVIAALQPDIIVGGPPCQDYSSAGGRVEGENAGLTRAFAMLVALGRPEWFVMENVRQAAKSKAWKDARAMLVSADYGLTEIALDASFYGVPQSRKRLFVIGRLGERDGFLASALAAAKSDRPMTVRDMLGEGIGDAFYVHPRYKHKRGLWSVDDPAPTVRTAYRHPIPKGYELTAADRDLLAKGAFFTRPFYTGRGVRTLDEPAPAIVRTTRERPRATYLSQPHPGDPVAVDQTAILTQEQVAKIQGFPVGWDWGAAKIRDIDQMIANAVPPPLAEAVGRVILARQAGQTIPAIEGRFFQWLRKRGRSPQSARNLMSQVNRARRLLGGHTFQNLALEIAALESTEGFAALSKKRQSDLRSALRLQAEWLSGPSENKQSQETGSQTTVAA